MRASKILSVATLALMLMSSEQAQSKVIYTGEIGKKVIGYNGPTPLNITIENNKITNIEILDNQESPKYLKKATQKVFPQYVGKTVTEALKLNADIATGATYTSKALIENIKLGLQNAKGIKPAASKRKKIKRSSK